MFLLYLQSARFLLQVLFEFMIAVSWDSLGLGVGEQQHCTINF